MQKTQILKKSPFTYVIEPAIFLKIFLRLHPCFSSGNCEIRFEEKSAFWSADKSSSTSQNSRMFWAKLSLTSRFAPLKLTEGGSYWFCKNYILFMLHALHECKICVFSMKISSTNKFLLIICKVRTFEALTQLCQT